MLEYISNSKCWKKITDSINIKKKEDKEYALLIFILLIVVLAIYFYHDEIKKLLRSSCKTLEIPINMVYNLEKSVVDSLTSELEYNF